MDTNELLRRRDALFAIGAGIGAVAGMELLWQPLEAEGSGCLLQREVTEGPYYLDLDLMRRNIRGGRPGTPLTLDFNVVDASTCKPIPGALVEIWHCDAGGVYSGVQGSGGSFLRGGQRAGGNGRVRFETIVPGWYPGRTPHIHMKVFVGGNEIHTGQVFFQSKTLRQVYAQGVYRSRGQADTGNRSDSIYQDAGKRAVVSLERKGTTIAKGLKGTLAIGVDQG
jgi:protocatechuate 3,4-dioxygenase beta subunit